MYKNAYRTPHRIPKRSKARLFLVLTLLAAGLFAVWKFAWPATVQRVFSSLEFDATVAASEKSAIEDAIAAQQLSYHGTVNVSVRTTLEPATSSPTLMAYVPVMNAYATRQNVSSDELASLSLALPEATDAAIKNGLADTLNVDSTNFLSMSSDPSELKDDQIAFIPVSSLSDKVKLLSFNDAYFLDTFSTGAIFRQVVFMGDGTENLATLRADNIPSKETVLKFNQTGVTALTRMMMRRLNTVGNATYFSDKIGSFLADADITHVSNEVSFKTGCTWHAALFCSPMEMIEVLKASGVDIVELTGNHNNDVGAQANTESINLYHSLGWATVGGGLNETEAAKPYTTDLKGTKLALLAYNYPDSPNGGAIAGPNKAGANSFDFSRIESDIKAAKDQGQYVIVDVQFWECYAYPEGYVEFPECDRPIPNQAEVFRRIADLGANMVVGTSAHQPQTYEFYKDSAIYYGLGNMYFDQDRWPGTERGIILSHYFIGGKLVQTRLSPTVYDSNYQTELMDNDKAVWLLERLKTAREIAFE